LKSRLANDEMNKYNKIAKSNILPTYKIKPKPLKFSLRVNILCHLTYLTKHKIFHVKFLGSFPYLSELQVFRVRDDSREDLINNNNSNKKQ
jgi:hypothetical protein